MNEVRGTLHPLGNKVLVAHMEFGIEKSKSGILLTSSDGKGSGIVPRWAQVIAVGPDQHEIKVGEWVLIEHGRWSRGFKYISNTNEELEVRLADNPAIMLACAEKPDDVMRSIAAGPGSNFNFNVPG